MARLFSLASFLFFCFAAVMAVHSAFGAAQVNPRSSGAWIARGLEAERTGDFDAAERALLGAARADRQYLPAWTLANFYFRHHNPRLFWPWATRAAALHYDDLRPLLKLCDLMEPDPVAALDRLESTAAIERAYLDFLIGENRLDAAQIVARRMLVLANRPRLIDLVDRQIRAGRVRDAIEIWNALDPFPRLDPTSVLTNGDLRRAPGGAGFDWRLPSCEGVVSEWRPSQLGFSFSGGEPEACPLLEQTLPLAAASLKRYRLRFEYSTPGMPSPAGLHWELDGVESPALDASDSWGAGEWTFRSHKPLASLRLIYRREPGTLRAEGRVSMRNLRLEAL